MKNLKTFLVASGLLTGCFQSNNTNTTSSTSPGDVTNIEKTTYNGNALSTPFFKMEYDSTSGSSKSASEKERFLKEMYLQFLKDATYGNEIYTLDKITFKEVANKNAPVAGEYFPKSNSISVFFPKDSSKQSLFSVMLHEYYHHLTVHKIDQALTIYLPKNTSYGVKYIDKYLYEEYMKMFNNGINQIEQNVKNIEDLYQVQKEDGTPEDANAKIFATNFLRYQAYNREIELYYENYFNKSPQKQIAWTLPDSLVPPYIDVLNSHKAFVPGSYKIRSDEILARWTSLMTNSFYPKENSVPKITFGRQVQDYLQTMFMRTNIYYDYASLNKRPYPRIMTIKDGREFYVKKEHNLTWNEVKGFQAKSLSQMQAKYQEWKNYFTNIFYNQDQLLSGAIRDKDNNLYIELNAKEKEITLENALNNQELKVKVETFKPVGQLSFNLKPFNLDGAKREKLTNNYLYKIKEKDLPVGLYNIKIDGKYQTKGMEIANLTNKVKVVWGVNPVQWTNEDRKVMPLYKFYLRNNKIVLEVV